MRKCYKGNYIYENCSKTHLTSKIIALSQNIEKITSITSKCAIYCRTLTNETFFDVRKFLPLH